MVTPGRRRDSPPLEELLGDVWGPGLVLADAAYLSRDNIELCLRRGLILVVKPRKGVKDAFQEYSGLDYIHYNRLLEEIGRRYQVFTEQGKRRPMTPSEVDMALYTFDKMGPTIGIRPAPPIDRSRKIKEFMRVIEEVVNDVYEVAEMPWAKRGGYSGMLRSFGEKLLRIMKGYARKGDLKCSTTINRR